MKKQPKPRTYSTMLSVSIRFRVTEADAALIAEAARLSGLSLTSYCRSLVTAHAANDVARTK